MKKFNDYKYISPIGVISEVKRRLNRYFSTNQLDESMFGLYIENCIRKLGVAVLDKTFAILKVENYKTKLPDDFHKLNVAYKCTSDDFIVNDFSTATVGKGFFNKSITCNDCNSCEKEVEEWEILKIELPAIRQQPFVFKHPELLYVGITKDLCIDGCKNFNGDPRNEIYIQGNTVTTNFSSGYIFWSYFTYLIDEDDTGFPMIIDEVWMTELIKSYLYYQFYEDLYNEITDETSNQIANKRQEYKREYEEKLIIARSESIAPTKAKIANLTIKDRNRLNVFNIRS